MPRHTNGEIIEQRRRRVFGLRGVAAIGALLLATAAAAQLPVAPRSDQDPKRNNLVHPAGYRAAAPDALGGVKRLGEGEATMVLIPGAGFGGEVFDGFMETHREKFSMFAVTLAGFGGTAAPPMPAEGTSYGEQTWTRGARAALARLIEKDVLGAATDGGVRPQPPIVVGHWLTGTQVALGLALERPDLVRAVVIISGVPKILPISFPEPPTLADRVALVDDVLAPRWFKTVTEETWHDNNFLPRDYALHDLRALQLWRLAARPSLPVWIRYLVEAWAQDVTLDLKRLEVPTLVLLPGFDDDFYAGPYKADYMRSFCIESWEGVAGMSDKLEMRTVPGSRAFMMDDRPEELSQAIDSFLGSL